MEKHCMAIAKNLMVSNLGIFYTFAQGVFVPITLEVYQFINNCNTPLISGKVK